MGVYIYHSNCSNMNNRRKRNGADNIEIEMLIDNLFALPEVEFMHIHNSNVQCFIAEVERIFYTCKYANTQAS
jgi:hypothetical protein